MDRIILRGAARGNTPLHLLLVGVVAFALGFSTLAFGYLRPTWALLLLAALAAPFAAVLVAQLADLRRVLLGVLLLELSVTYDAYLGWYEGIPSRFGSLVGWNVSVVTAMLVALYALWIGERLFRGDSPSPPRLHLSPALLLYVGIVAVSMFWARNVALSLFELFVLVQALLLYLYVASHTRTVADVLFVVAMLLIGLVVQSLIAIALPHVGDLRIGSLQAQVAPVPGAGLSRTTGTFGSPNVAAGYFTLLLAPALAIVLAGFRLPWRLLATVALGCGTLALLLTQSRGGWIAFAISTGMVGLLVARRRGMGPVVPLAALAGTGALLFIFGDALLARIRDDDGAAASRLPLMELAWAMIADYPLTGVGANNFATVMWEYVTPEFTREWLFTVHNKYLLIWAENGLLGLAAFLWFLGATLRHGWRVWTRGGPLVAALALGFTAAVVGHLQHMAFDVFNSRMPFQLLCLVAGLLHAMDTAEIDPSQPVAEEVRRESAKVGALT